MLTGTLRSITRRDLDQRLNQQGAALVQNVSRHTDAVVEGQGWSEKPAAARRRGIPVLTEEHLLALLDGKDFDQVVAAACPKPPIALPDDALEQFEGFDLTEPSKERWAQITALLDRCGPELAEVAVDYLTEAIEHWDDALDLSVAPYHDTTGPGTAPVGWAEAILRGEDHPKHRLVRILDLRRLKLTGKVANHLFDCPHLANLRLLRLDDNPKLPAAFFKNLAHAPHLRTLTHLSMSQIPITPNHAAALAETPHLRPTHLGLSGNVAEDAAVLRTLFRSPAWSRLQHVDYHVRLANGTTSAAGMATLAANPAVEGLRSIRWRYPPAGALDPLLSRFAATLAEIAIHSAPPDLAHTIRHAGLVRVTALRIFDGAPLTDDLSALLGLAAMVHLQALELYAIGCDDAAIAALTQRAPPDLRVLDLRNNPLSDDALAALLASPCARHLRQLRLADTGFGPASAEVLCQTPFPHLDALTIARTQAREEDFDRLCKAPSLPALRRIYSDFKQFDRDRQQERSQRGR